MVIVYYTVRKQAQKAKKWRLGGGKKGGPSLETEVFWQCLYYTAAFYITWPIMFSVYLKSVDDKHRLFGLSMTVAFVAPLSGFTNALVFVRPQVKERVKKFRASFFSEGTSWPKSGDKSSRGARRQTNSIQKGASETEQTDSENPAFRDMDPSAILPLRENPLEQAKEKENIVVNVAKEEDTQERLVAEIPESQELQLEDKMMSLDEGGDEDAWFREYRSKIRSLSEMAKP